MPLFVCRVCNFIEIGELYFIQIENIEIPSSVTKIGEMAFIDCYNLTIYCEAESEPGNWSLSWNYSNRQVVWGYKKS